MIICLGESNGFPYGSRSVKRQKNDCQLPGSPAIYKTCDHFSTKQGYFFYVSGTLDFYKAYRFPPEIVQQAMALSPVYSEGARADSLDES
jgi:hypothetical protein